MQFAIPIYDRFTALDAVGPYEVLSRLPGARVRFVAAQAGPVRTETRMLTMLADAAYEEVPRPDVVLVPGGVGNRVLLGDDRLLGWLRDAHEHTAWTASVCTGSLLLGAAGILDGLEATSHWAELETLRRFGARPVKRRVVQQGKVMTGAGVSAGIDLALTLAARIAGDELAQAIQLGIEYDPQPPFAAGSADSAPPEIVAAVERVIEAVQRSNA